MKNKYLEPEIKIIKLLTEDVVYTSGEGDIEIGEYDKFPEGENFTNVGGLS